MTKKFLVLLFAAFVGASSALADDASFTVNFTNCTEFAGEGYVPLANAQPLVPAGYTINASSGQAPIVVRTTSCQGVQVDRSPTLPAIVSQIGINVVSPDGTGTINNYTALYVTNNVFLVRAFRRSGVPAVFDPEISYEYTLNAASTGGVLYEAVPTGGGAAYFLYGPETEPAPNSAQLFIANWWYGPKAAVRQQTTIPAISFGTSSVVLYTSNKSALGKLIGGNSYGNFSVLSLRGEFSNAQMIVTGSSRW